MVDFPSLEVPNPHLMEAVACLLLMYLVCFKHQGGMTIYCIWAISVADFLHQLTLASDGPRNPHQIYNPTLLPLWFLLGWKLGGPSVLHATFSLLPAVEKATTPRPPKGVSLVESYGKNIRQLPVHLKW